MNPQPIESPEPTSHDADPSRPGTPGEPQIHHVRLPPGDEAPGDPADQPDLPGVIQPPKRPGIGPEVPTFSGKPSFGIPTPPPIMPVGPKPIGATPRPFPTITGGLATGTQPQLPPDSSWQKFSDAFRTSGKSPLRLHFKVDQVAVRFELVEWNALGIPQVKWSDTLQSGECAIVAQRPFDPRCRLVTVSPTLGGGLWAVTAIGEENQQSDFVVSGNVKMQG